MESLSIKVLNEPIDVRLYEICDMMEMRIKYKGDDCIKFETLIDIFRFGNEFNFVSILGVCGYNLKTFIRNYLFYRFKLEDIRRIDYIEINRSSIAVNVENKSYNDLDLYFGMKD